jgi:CMP-N,N'-diacetyllegionaminic acid synthase
MIAGKPLIAHSVIQAVGSKLFDQVVVSSDSEHILSIAKDHGASTFFKRSDILSEDQTPKLEVIKDALIKSEEFFNKTFDIIMDIDATSPLRNIEDLSNALQLFLEKGYENLFSVTPSRRNPYFNMVEVDDEKVQLVKELEKTFYTRQSSPKTYDMNASIYIWQRESLYKKTSLFNEKTGIYIMPEERSIDIDTEFDFKLVKYLLERKSISRF